MHARTQDPSCGWIVHLPKLLKDEQHDYGPHCHSGKIDWASSKSLSLAAISMWNSWRNSKGA